jgi:hypothetical protein
MYRSFTFGIGVAWIALALVSCGGGDSGGGGPAPRFIVAAHGTADFNYGVTDIDDVCPHEVDFSIFLEDGGRGWVAIEHRAWGSDVFEVTWTRSQHGYEVVAPPNARATGVFQSDRYYSADVGWEDLAFTVVDEDGDGTAETGNATATLICDWEIVLIPQTETYDSSFALRNGETQAELGMSGAYLAPMFPFNDVLQVLASRPLLAESIPGSAHLFVDGEPVAATITATGTEGPFANGFRIDPLLRCRSTQT